MKLLADAIVAKPRVHWNLLFTIAAYAVFGIYTELQIMTFSTLAQPLSEMFNSTLYRHYGIVASSGGLSLVTSSMNIGFGIGTTIATIVVLPRLDSRGRKFVTVYSRFFFGLTTGVLQLIAGLTSSAELYFLGQIGVGCSLPCLYIATTIYLTECSSDSSRGFASTALQVGSLLGALMMYFLASPSILGNIHRWPVIPAITLVLCFLHFFSTVFLPDSPRWLMSKDRKEEAKRSVIFYQKVTEEDADTVLTECLMENRLTEQEKLSVRDIFVDDSLRAALLIIAALQSLVAFSLMPVENLYVVTIHTQLGLTVGQSMQLKFLVHLLCSPLRFMGTLLMDHCGRRFVFCLSAVIGYSKILLMVVAQILVYMGPPSTVTIWMVIINEILSELHGATGVAALSTLLITELLPPAARVSGAQVLFIVMFFSNMPMAVLFPLFNSIFSPGFYLFLMIIQPFILIYVFRNLPETNAKSVYDIVHDLDEELRSRSNTKRNSVVSNGKRQSLFSERQRLLTNYSVASYSAMI